MMRNLYYFKSKINIKQIALIFFMYLLIFENALEAKFYMFGKIDELVSISIILIGMIKIVVMRDYLRNELSKSYKILFAILLFICIGLTGNFIFKYQYMQYAIRDIISLRGLICYGMIPIVFLDFNYKEYMRVVNINLRIITLILFTLTICNLFMNFYPHFEVRFGIKAQQLFFSHPTYLANTCVLIIALLSVSIFRCKGNIIYIGLIGIVTLLTLRTKVIVFVIAYIYLLFIVIIRKRKLNKKDLIIIMIIASILTVGKVTEYLQNPDWARSALVINSTKIAGQHFPFGSGFGTFGSWKSAVNYSPLYYTYGMECLWGTSPDAYFFIADTFWPMVLAQVGIFGLIIMVYIIAKIYMSISKQDDLCVYLGQMSILIYMVTASIAEPTFTGPYATISLIIIGLLNNTKRRYISSVRTISFYNF